MLQQPRIRTSVANPIRFQVNFMFQLTENEVDEMVSQNAIPSRQYLGGALPYAFTKHSILMLANVLKSEQAVKVSINIIELFIKMRELIITQQDLLLKREKIEHKMLNQNIQLCKHDQELQILFNTLKQLLKTPQVPRK